MKYLLLPLLLLAGCSTPHLTSAGPKWNVQAFCYDKAKTQAFDSVANESSCGAQLNVYLLEGGK